MAEFYAGLAVGSFVTLVLIIVAVAYKVLKEETRVQKAIDAEERAWKTKRDKRRKREQNSKANSD